MLPLMLALMLPLMLALMLPLMLPARGLAETKRRGEKFASRGRDH